MKEYCDGCNGFLDENGKHRCGVESRPLNWPSKEEQEKARYNEILKIVSDRYHKENSWDAAILWIKEFMEKK